MLPLPLERLSRMSPKLKALVAIAVSLLFAVNTVYAMGMRADFQMDQKGKSHAEQPVEKKKACHGDSHDSSSTFTDDYSYDCCGVDCLTCTSASLLQNPQGGHASTRFSSVIVIDIPSSPLDAHASNLYRPPIFS